MEPPLQRKKKFHSEQDFSSNRGVNEPPLQHKKRPGSTSPIRTVKEPALQNKKRTNHSSDRVFPITNDLLPPSELYDEYVLLGDQSKFNNNVKYKVRSNSANRSDDYEKKAKSNVANQKNERRNERKEYDGKGSSYGVRDDMHDESRTDNHHHHHGGGANYRHDHHHHHDHHRNHHHDFNKEQERGRSREKRVQTEERKVQENNMHNNAKSGKSQERSPAPKVIVDTSKPEGFNKRPIRKSAESQTNRVNDQRGYKTNGKRYASLDQNVTEERLNVNGFNSNVPPKPSEGVPYFTTKKDFGKYVDDIRKEDELKRRKERENMLGLEQRKRVEYENGKREHSVGMQAGMGNVNGDRQGQGGQGNLKQRKVEVKVDQEEDYEGEVFRGDRRRRNAENHRKQKVHEDLEMKSREYNKENKERSKSKENIKQANNRINRAMVDEDYRNGPNKNRPDRMDDRRTEDVERHPEKRATISDTKNNKQEDYAAKYRIGMLRRAPGPKRSSEYQRQFQWRDMTKASPLLNAETMVYRSQPELNLHRLEKFAEDGSEYRSQFRSWSVQGSYNQADPIEEQKIERSRSLRDLRSEALLRRQEDGRAESQDRQTSENIHRKCAKSEYDQNFQPPWNYKFKDGFWKQMNQRKEEKSMAPGDVVEHRRPTTLVDCDWYAEVLELRRSADEYKKRARGTHFSREHLAQLYAKNAELWDTVSNNSALNSVERERELNAKKKYVSRETQSNRLNDFEEEFVPEYDDDDDDDDDQSLTDRRNQSPIELGEEKENIPQNSNFQKTKLNLTRTIPRKNSIEEVFTPDSLNSNASLVKDKHKVAKQPQNNKTIQVDTRSKTLKHNTAVLKTKKPNLIPRYGVPTRDTHVMCYPDQQPTSRSEEVQSKPEESEPSRMKQMSMERPLHQENNGARNDVSDYDDDDDDTVTRSTARSAVSSNCSLASEVLERARKRRNEFWSKP